MNIDGKISKNNDKVENHNERNIGDHKIDAVTRNKNKKLLLLQKSIPENERTDLQTIQNLPNFDKIVGKKIVGSAINKIHDVFNCNYCECSFKDNSAYLNHLNGKRHNRVLGMNMKVKHISKKKVIAKLKSLQNKKNSQI